MKEIQFLKGERVYLRPFTDEDTDFFDVWYNDARTRAKIAAPYPTTAAQS
ncbi:GNAT family N-acetyltransferase [[Clostridium] innocuum]|nr:GNAT family N-acetyltransferase [[Clostridium] innocuum]